MIDVLDQGNVSWIDRTRPARDFGWIHRVSESCHIGLSRYEHFAGFKICESGRERVVYVLFPIVETLNANDYPSF